jgi:hypothetical protein
MLNSPNTYRAIKQHLFLSKSTLEKDKESCYKFRATKILFSIALSQKRRIMVKNYVRIQRN